MPFSIDSFLAFNSSYCAAGGQEESWVGGREGKGGQSEVEREEKSETISFV